MTTATLLLAVLTNAAQLSSALRDNATNETFDLTGTVIFNTLAANHDMAVEDASGSVVILSASNSVPPRAGKIVRAIGNIRNKHSGHTAAMASDIRVLRETALPPIETGSFEQILRGRYDARPVRTTGMLRDYFFDEIDPEYLFLILNSDKRTLYATTSLYTADDIRRLDSLLGREVTVTGLCDPRPSGCRRKIGRLIRINDCSALRAAPSEATDPFRLPLFNAARQAQPAELSSLGRRRIVGRVIAVWQKDALLLRTPDGRLSRIDLAKADPPAFHANIEVVGFPETDLYRVNFSRAIWRAVPADRPAEECSPTDIPAQALMTGLNGGTAFNADFHGRTVRLRGTVCSLPGIGNDGRFYLESDGYTLPIDISANPPLAGKLEIGGVIDVTGVCVTDIENWRPNLVFPHIKEVMVVTRTPEDIAIVRRPPWWTPSRLLIVIGSLLAALLGILAWNRALQTLARKRGKALANEELERLEADLKSCERTRLAVALHDSIAQNLTGVSMEIDSALCHGEAMPPDAAKHLNRASKTLDACRMELRNCIWDLRSQALDEEDMNTAIRLTLGPTIGRTGLSVRFNVPRSRFTYNTARTILNILRELASNAVRHGHATELRIAGNLEDETLRFSLRDNGSGFDPATRPGVREGHFGLQGIQDRVTSYEGEMEIDSRPGGGCKVTITLLARPDDDKEKI